MISTIGSFAKLTSTTGRTLRFYDRKGLLKPSGYNEQGHRFYTDEDLFRLQQILTLKYLDFSLDEIGQYLEQDSKDFKTSLEMQYELLLQKQQHIERILATIERIRAIVKDDSTIDPGLIIVMIQSIQREEEQKQWLSDRLPDTIVQSIFMSGSSLEEKIQVERETTVGLNDLLNMSRQGLHPEHPLVQERALKLTLSLKRLLGEALNDPWTSEMGSVFEEMKPQPCVDPEFKTYLHEVFAHLSIRREQQAAASKNS
ncbi:MerR family transcriptional regulator [Paenibacillus lautus]|uniref:MerR family transcriptional regulator n=1 Tax=Paenibacillus lautus TaxID=1401 RepID=UPI003D2AEF23